MTPPFFVFPLAISLILPVLPAYADGLYNPFPVIIQSPRDDNEGAVKRLTINSDGKTPVLKNFDGAWIKSLADRGTPTVFTKENSHSFDYIGMPVGGIGAGELYLSGDGRLWNWDIFGTLCHRGFPIEQGGAYRSPHKVGNVADPMQVILDQGFVLRTRQREKVDTRTLDKNGFSNVSFSGQYPIGSVNYSDPSSPVHVHLDAFSPFIPSNVADSTYPATILTYTIENTSREQVECTIGGWMENASGNKVRELGPIYLQNTAVESQAYQAVNFTMKIDPNDMVPAAMFDDFESGKYDHWKVEGDAFGEHPTRMSEFTHHSPVQGSVGNYFIDSYSASSDTAMGKLTSTPFVIDRSFMTFLVGGGSDPKQECVTLIVDGKVVRSASGRNDETLRPMSWDLRNLVGKTAQVQVVDNSSGAWGHILVDNIAFADSPYPLKDQSDVGEMTLAILGEGSVSAQITGDPISYACLDAPPSRSAEVKIVGAQRKLVGAVRRTHTLAPGAKMEASFLVAWDFPNPLDLGLATDNSRQYRTRFKSAQEVVEHLVTNFARLSSSTLAWRDTWYDSSLPYYFLDRTFLNVSTLATSTSYLMADGRFYGYEGRYSCPGTCTHVWSYQQAMGYLFPDLEKAIMEKTEFVQPLGMNSDGGVFMRAEFDHKIPVDGQAGIILRTYLAYRMSPDDEFLERNYQLVKKAMDFLINTYDPTHQGILDGAQANTMDSAWYGKITWLSLYYQAALRAAAQMADASKDSVYGKSLTAIADQGRAIVENQLFNGEYFLHLPDSTHTDSPGTYNGCPIEQLMGQNWAYEVGLGDIVDHGKALTALDSIWKYNYTTDAGVYRDKFKTGRWYAVAGEGGLIMCTFPHGGEDALTKGNPGFAAYNNECWSGSEYEAASLMMWDGQVDKALAEVSTLEERYAPSKRNPWNELECGSHYSRSMSSYGLFIAACGFEYDGPNGLIAFAPRVAPEDFKAAFTCAQGWGSFRQQYNGTGMNAALTLNYGKLRLKAMRLVPPAGNTIHTAQMEVDGKEQPVTVGHQGQWILLSFSSDVLMTAGQTVKIRMAP